MKLDLPSEDSSHSDTSNCNSTTEIMTSNLSRLFNDSTEKELIPLHLMKDL